MNTLIVCAVLAALVALQARILFLQSRFLKILREERPDLYTQVHAWSRATVRQYFGLRGLTPLTEFILLRKYRDVGNSELNEFGDRLVTWYDRRATFPVLFFIIVLMLYVLLFAYWAIFPGS